MAVFGFGRRNAVGRQYNGGNVSVMLPRYTTPPERNTRDWLEMFGRNPRLAVVDRIASDLSTCAGKLYRKDENGEAERRHSESRGRADRRFDELHQIAERRNG